MERSEVEQAERRICSTTTPYGVGGGAEQSGGGFSQVEQMQVEHVEMTPGSLTSDLMPILQRTGDDLTAWWIPARRAPFDAHEVAAWQPWPTEVAGAVLCRALLAECDAHRGPPTVAVERLHILHEGHPSERVRLKAWCALQELGVDDDGLCDDD